MIKVTELLNSQKKRELTNLPKLALTLSQTTNLRLFQTERVSR